jgi:hypothetical protein
MAGRGHPLPGDLVLCACAVCCAPRKMAPQLPGSHQAYACRRHGSVPGWASLISQACEQDCSQHWQATAVRRCCCSSTCCMA